MTKDARPYKVLLTQGAEQDLEALYDYIAEYDSAARADRLLDQVLQVTESLRQYPERGSHPRELLELGIKEYRQMAFKPYRLLYRITDDRVVIHLVADGRRDMRSLLSRRLLEA